jgi:IclR family transcriptional regulator, KDG regulon repressor
MSDWHRLDRHLVDFYTRSHLSRSNFRIVEVRDDMVLRTQTDTPSGTAAELRDGRSDPTLSTLDRGLRILELLASDEAKVGMTLTELGHALGMHRSTMFRFLATLRARGYIDRDPVTDRYRLGSRVLTIAGAFLDNLDIRHVARPALQALCDRTHELVHLATLDRGEVVTVERIEGKHPVSLQTGVGARRPVYCTASGKAILAYLPAETVDDLLARGMDAYTPRTITTPESMHEHLSEVRRLGYSIDDEERIEGVRCAASPVFGHEGNVVAAISVASPIQRTPHDRLCQLGEEVRMAADVISRQLGYMGPNLSSTAQESHPIGVLRGS